MTEAVGDVKVLEDVTANIDELLGKVRANLHSGAPLREQMDLIGRVAEQFDLAGMHDAARGFRQQMDALVPLRDMQDRHAADDQARADRRSKLRRRLTFGLVS